MTTRIDLGLPPSALEGASAAQAMNRRRLAEREESDRLKRQASREVGRLRSDVNSPQSRNAGDKDPWRGAVPEFQDPSLAPVQLRGKRFKVAVGYAQVVGDRLEVRTGDGSINQSIELFKVTPTGYPFVFFDFGSRPWGVLLPGGRDRLVFVVSQVWAWQEWSIEASQAILIAEQFFNSHKSFIVTKDAVKVVDTPATIRAIGERFNGLPRRDEDDPNRPGMLRTYFPNRPSSSQKWSFDLSERYLMLLRSYGYGRLLSLETDFSPGPRGPAQSPNWGTTPAIFSFLKNYNGEFHRIDAEPESSIESAESYTYIKNKYFPVDAPDYMLTSGWQVPGSEVDTTDLLYYLRTPDLQGASIRSLGAFNDASPRPNRERNVNLPAYASIVFSQEFISGSAYNYLFNSTFTAPVPLVTWDWNRPLACILQLQSLGFTAEDLMLTPEETAALAAADPAVVGFKF